MRAGQTISWPLRWRTLAGTVALVACGSYFIAQAIAAAGWRAGSYSYTHNYISDLGIPCEAGGSALCSPMADVMNGALSLAAVMTLGAAALLAPLIVKPWRAVVLFLTAFHAAGTLGVALIHSAPGTAAGTPPAHIIAAYFAVLGGHAMLIATGLAARRSGAPAWFMVTSIAAGLLGLAGAIALVATGKAAPGLFERVAVDVITLWKVFVGLSLAGALISRPRYAPILAERP